MKQVSWKASKLYNHLTSAFYPIPYNKNKRLVAGGKFEMRMTVGKKLGLGFFSVIFIVLMVGLSGLWALWKLNTEYQSLLKNNVETVLMFEQLLSDQNEDAKNIHAYILYEDDVYLNHRQEVVDAIKLKIKQLDKRLASKKEKELLKEIKETSFTFQQISEIVIRDVNEGNMDSAMKISAEAAIYQVAVTEQIEQLIVIQKKAQQQTEENLQQIAKGIQLFIIVMIGVAILVSSIIARLISENIANPVRKMTRALKKLAKGNFIIEPVTLKNQDEIGEMSYAFNDMVLDLHALITNARLSAEQLSGHAEELSASAEESLAASETVARITEKNIISCDVQVKIVKESATAMDEMVTSLNRITDDNEAMLLSSNEVVRLVDDGVSLMFDFTKQMQSITTTIEHSTEIMREMAIHSEQIRTVTSLITVIAEQTNLLALNAAIEAARAGEHGKGFAVVAGEVRKLAEQSKQSAEIIGRMIDTMMNNVDKAVSSTEDNNKRVFEGMSVTEKTETVFTQISDAVKDMSEKSITVATAVEQIRAMTDEIANSLSTIEMLAQEAAMEAQSSNAATEEQFAAVGEISTSSQTLAELAETLHGNMARFRV